MISKKKKRKVVMFERMEMDTIMEITVIMMIFIIKKWKRANMNIQKTLRNARMSSSKMRHFMIQFIIFKLRSQR